MVLMLMMLASPTLARNLVTISSNLSWPTSMHSPWRMVLVWMVLSASLAASSGMRGFSIKLAAGVEWTGTRKCISILAAAEEEIGFDGLAAKRGAPESVSTPGRETADSG